MSECSPRCIEMHTYAAGCALDILQRKPPQDRSGPNLMVLLLLLTVIAVASGLIYGSVLALLELQSMIGPTPDCA